METFVDRKFPDDGDSDQNPDTNPRLDSRTETRILVDRTIARMHLGLSLNEEVARIREPSTRPFRQIGSSFNQGDKDAFCSREGDYDFALIDWLRLVYAARAHPGALPDDVYRKIVNQLLSETGGDDYQRFSIRCSGVPVAVRLKDTENHILMVAVARLLTNDLRAEFPENKGNANYDSARLGLYDRMLEHLAVFFRDYFDEYNSRPYQAFTVRALEVLHDGVKDTRLKLAARMTLDMVSGMTAIQSLGLRRFPAFRRQPRYIKADSIAKTAGDRSWAADGEVARLSVLAGNYDLLGVYNWELPATPSEPAFDTFALAAAAASYRVEPLLLHVMIEKGLEQYEVEMAHQNIEVYSASKHFLLSAGGVFRKGVPPAVEGLGLGPFQGLVENAVAGQVDDQHGYSRPTLLIPWQEPSSSEYDLLGFVGGDDLERRSNTCVAPGFACGLDPRIPERIRAADASCSDTAGGYRFYDFTRSGCPIDYGFYVALYARDCDSAACREIASQDRFGLFEVSEPTVAFEEFKASVLRTNPGPFSSSSRHTYRTQSGRTIDFVVQPASDRGSIVALDGEPRGDSLSGWARARGKGFISTTKGRLTFDSVSSNQRLILDMTTPKAPRRLVVGRPTLRYSTSYGGTSGVYFDDAEAVIPNEDIAAIALKHGERIDGIAVDYTSGLTTQRGASGATRFALEAGEHIVEVGLGVVQARGSDRIGRLRIRTSRGRELTGGQARETAVLRAAADERIVGFFGRAGGEIDRLGVVFGPLSEARGTNDDGDAGLDAGATEGGAPDAGALDAGAPDAGTTPLDAAAPSPSDAGSSNPDATLGSAPDAGGKPTGGSGGTDTVIDPVTVVDDPMEGTASGCACSTAGQATDPSGFIWIAALLWRGRRRRP